MSAGLFPLLRAAAASEIAKAFGLTEATGPATPNPTPQPTDLSQAAQGKGPDSLLSILASLGAPTADIGLSGLAAPRSMAALDAASLLPQSLSGATAASGPQRTDLPAAPAVPTGTTSASSPAPTTLTQAADGTAPTGPDGPRPATAPSAQDVPLPSHGALRAALSAALPAEMSYGAFPFTLGATGASAASLVIFNAAMSPSWPPALRLGQTPGDDQSIRLAGAQLAQMSPQEMSEFLARMAAIFGFLLTVKKRLSRSLQEEKETILGLFALFGVAMDSLVKGLQLAVSLTAEQKEVLDRVAVELSGQPAGNAGSRHRLRL